jgi:hypothetical protein
MGSYVRGVNLGSSGTKYFSATDSGVGGSSAPTCSPNLNGIGCTATLVKHACSLHNFKVYVTGGASTTSTVTIYSSTSPADLSTMTSTGISCAVKGTGSCADDTTTALSDDTLISFQVAVAGYAPGSFVWIGVDCE